MIHLLRLLSATVVIVRDPDADANKSETETETETGKDHAEIYYDNVGFLYDTTSKMIHNINNAANDSEAGGNRGVR